MPGKKLKVLRYDNKIIDNTDYFFLGHGILRMKYLTKKKNL